MSGFLSGFPPPDSPNYRPEDFTRGSRRAELLVGLGCAAIVGALLVLFIVLLAKGHTG